MGLNPSRIEFQRNGAELDGRERRFETLRSLGVSRLDDAPEEVVRRVWERCNRYFHGNPYRRWFDRLEEVLAAVGASYYGDSACHLDLSQWATDPTWNSLPGEARARLVAEDAEFLKTQLAAEPIRVLLLNGRGVLRAFQRVLGGQLEEAGEAVSDRLVTTRIYTGTYGALAVVGWSTNLQSSVGVTNRLRSAIASRVGELAGTSNGAHPSVQP